MSTFIPNYASILSLEMEAQADATRCCIILILLVQLSLEEGVSEGVSVSLHALPVSLSDIIVINQFKWCRLYSLNCQFTKRRAPIAIGIATFNTLALTSLPYELSNTINSSHSVVSDLSADLNKLTLAKDVLKLKADLYKLFNSV